MHELRAPAKESGSDCSEPTSTLARAYLKPTWPTRKTLDGLLGAYRAYLEPTLPNSKSFEFIALSLPSLPRAYLANQQSNEIHCVESTEPTWSLPCQRANHLNKLL